MKIIFLGAPGAGKGTQAELLSAKLHIPTISTGAMIRQALKEETPMGLSAKAYIEAGKLVPDEVVIGIVKERLSQDDCKNGFILDGFPRTIAQAEALDAMGVSIDVVLNLVVDDSVIVARMSGRRVCPGCGATYHISSYPSKDGKTCDKCGAALTVRKDDDPAVVQDRLTVYHKETEPLVQYYEQKGILKTAHGADQVEETTARTFRAIGV